MKCFTQANQVSPGEIVKSVSLAYLGAHKVRKVETEWINSACGGPLAPVEMTEHVTLHFDTWSLWLDGDAKMEVIV